MPLFEGSKTIIISNFFSKSATKSQEKSKSFYKSLDCQGAIDWYAALKTEEYCLYMKNDFNFDFDCINDERSALNGGALCEKERCITDISFLTRKNFRRDFRI